MFLHTLIALLHSAHVRIFVFFRKKQAMYKNTVPVFQFPCCILTVSARFIQRHPFWRMEHA